MYKLEIIYNADNIIYYNKYSDNLEVLKKYIKNKTINTNHIWVTEYLVYSYCKNAIIEYKIINIIKPYYKLILVNNNLKKKIYKYDKLKKCVDHILDLNINDYIYLPEYDYIWYDIKNKKKYCLIILEIYEYNDIVIDV